MAKKVKALFTFIGSAEEVEKFGGQTPEHLKKFETKFTEGDRASFRGLITAGTELSVSDKRAKELQVNDLVEVIGEDDEDEPKAEGAQGQTNEPKGSVLQREKAERQAVEEKKSHAGPNAKK